MLKNFSFGEGDDALLIGDVTMTNLTGKEENGAITFETEQDAIITNGEGVPVIVLLSIGEISAPNNISITSLRSDVHL